MNSESPGGLEQRLDTLIRLLAISLTHGRRRIDQIELLSRVGMRPKQIAELLGTTAHTVSVTLSELRKRGSRSNDEGP